MNSCVTSAPAPWCFSIECAYGSFCFRYPVNMRGENALDRDFRFDLSNFSTRMDGVLTFLDHVDCGVMGVLDETQQVNS